MVTPPGKLARAEGLSEYSSASARAMWVSSGSLTPLCFRKRSSTRLRRALGMDFRVSTVGRASKFAWEERHSSSFLSRRAIWDRFSASRGFSAVSKGITWWRIRFRRKVSVSLELSSTWLKHQLSRNISASCRVTVSMGRISFPRTGAMPPRPFSPVPRTRCISTVSALSSAVWAVAIFPSSPSRNPYLASLAAASSPFLPETTLPDPT